jgi:uncharacterized membrane protein
MKKYKAHFMERVNIISMIRESIKSAINQKGFMVALSSTYLMVSNSVLYVIAISITINLLRQEKKYAIQIKWSAEQAII